MGRNKVELKKLIEEKKNRLKGAKVKMVEYDGVQLSDLKPRVIDVELEKVLVDSVEQMQIDVSNLMKKKRELESQIEEININVGRKEMLMGRMRDKLVSLRNS